MGCSLSHSEAAEEIERTDWDHAPRSPPLTDKSTIAARRTHLQSDDGKSAASHDIPPLFVASSSAYAVKDFASIKELMMEWKGYPRRTGTDSASLIRNVRLLLDISQHPVATTASFSEASLFRAIDIAAVTHILASGHTNHACIDAADPTGRGIENLVAAVDCLLRPASNILKFAMAKSNGDSTFRESVARLTEEMLCGPSSALSNMGLSGKMGPFEMYKKGLSNGLRVLILCCGGTTGLVANLGDTNLPQLVQIDCIARTLCEAVFAPDGRFTADEVHSYNILSQFSSALQYLGVLPNPERREAESSPTAVLFQQFPFPFLSIDLRRALVSIEFQLHRRRPEPAVVIPYIAENMPVLSAYVAELVSSGIVPATVAEFRQASCRKNLCTVARLFVFSSQSQQGMPHNEDPWQVFVRRASNLLTSPVGATTDLSNIFGLIQIVSTDASEALRCGQPIADNWEHYVQVGDVILIDACSYDVTEVSLCSLDESTHSNHCDLIPGLVPIDRADRVELTISIKSAPLDADRNSNAKAQPLPPMTVASVVRHRKRANPIFVPRSAGQGELVINDALPEITPDGALYGGISLGGHWSRAMGSSHAAMSRIYDNTSRRSLRASVLSRASASAAYHVDSIGGPRSRIAVLETLQLFYFVGWLIAIALTHNRTLSCALPILMFRALKSYQQSQANTLYPGNDAAGPSSPQSDPAHNTLEPSFTCHFVPTVDDLLERGDRESTLDEIAKIRHMTIDEFDEFLSRVGPPEWHDLSKDEYIAGYLLETTVLSPTHRLYLDATFIALAESGVVQSMVWQLSSPRELRDMVCRSTQNEQ